MTRRTSAATRVEPERARTAALIGARVLARYQRGWLRFDVLAGVTVAAYLVPQVMAYAQLAGLEPVVGLWAALAAPIVYAFLGTSRRLSSGPESTTAVMVAAAVAPLAAGDPVRYAALTAGLALLVGAFCLVGGVLRLGFLADLLSRPILVGFMAGVAVVMIVSQLERMTGVPVDGDGIVAEVAAFVTNLSAVHLPTLALSATVVVFLLVAQRFAPGLPGPLIAVIGATVLVAVLNLETAGVALVGQIPSGLPRLGLPAVGLDDVPLLAASALGIAVVGYTDVILTARSFAKRDEPIDPNAELLALGGANLAAGLSSGMPVSSSASRTAIAESLGSRSQVMSIVTALCVLLVLLFAGRLLALFPIAALGGLVVYAALRLIDIAEFRRLARFRPTELALALVAMAGVLVVDVLAGILIAIGLSVVALFARVARPKAAVLGRPPGVAGLHDIRDYPDAVTVPGLVVFRYDAPLVFANANDFKARALAAVEEAPAPAEWLLINAEAIVDIDLTAADALGELHDELERRGIVLALARVKQDLRDQLETIGMITHIGPEWLFATLPVAEEAFAHRNDGRPRQVWTGAPDEEPGAHDRAGH